MMDKKGRIFGKLNIVDLLVIVLVLAVVAVLGIKFLGKGGESAAPETTPIRFTVKVTGVHPEVYENAVGTLPGQLMASGSLVGNAYVVGVTAESQAAEVDFAVGNQSILMVGNSDLLDLTFTIEGEVTNTTTFECGKQEIRIGKSYIVKTVDMELSGVIMSREIIEK